MAINRAPWNALVDDDGSNLIGSVWNKAAIKTVLLDPIDAMGGGGQTALVSTVTGTVHNWAPGLTTGQDAVISWEGTAAVAITGIAGGVTGQVVTIRNHGTGIMTFASGNAGSLAANRLHNIALSAPTPIAALGFAQYIYNQGLWRLLAQEQGAWIAPAFSAADYTGGTMTWTVTAGQVQDASYRLSGRTLAWSLSVSASTVGGTPANALIRTIPGGFMGARTMAAQFGFVNVAAVGSSIAQAFPDVPKIYFYRDMSGGVNWSAGNAVINTSGQIEVR